MRFPAEVKSTDVPNRQHEEQPPDADWEVSPTSRLTSTIGIWLVERPLPTALRKLSWLSKARQEGTFAPIS
jgi:hypothetical protein